MLKNMRITPFRASPPFPAACVLVFLFSWLVLQNFTDGVFYLGYALHFRELIDRVGLTYSTGGFNAAPRGVRSKIRFQQIKIVRLANPADE
jgi:hypothetical protein